MVYDQISRPEEHRSFECWKNQLTSDNVVVCIVHHRSHAVVVVVGVQFARKIRARRERSFHEGSHVAPPARRNRSRARERDYDCEE